MSENKYFQYKTIVELAGEAVVIIQDEKIVYTNPKCSQLTGYTREEIMSTPFIEFIYHEDRDRVMKNFQNRIKGLPAEKEYDFRIVHKNGSIKWFHIRPVIIQWNGRPAVLDFLVDVTERKFLEEKLKQSLAILKATIDSTEDAILVIDKNANVLTYNKSFLKLWNLVDKDMQLDGKKLLNKIKHNLKDSQKFVVAIQEIHKNPNRVIKDTFELKDGRVFSRYSYPFKIDGKIYGRVWYSKDITESIKYEKELEKLASTDHLTGLFNRRKFMSILESFVEKNAVPFSLIMFDIDNFKSINDTYGHHTGDTILKEVSNRVSSLLDDRCIFSRWGGEEFMILFSGAKLGDGLFLAKLILKSINKIRYNSKYVSASFGITEFKKNETIFELLKRVDEAMYIAKTTGKNKVVAL
ncbi:MAG: diguanylate cyclase [Aquificae bacterium]|nr:diguanylate cyclase [Aquificota bacterium]